MLLPVPVAIALNESRNVPDIDPEESWAQWSFLRRKIEEQGLAVESAVPKPTEQLASDIEALSQILQRFQIATPEVISHQVGVLEDYAKQFIAALAESF